MCYKHTGTSYVKYLTSQVVPGFLAHRRAFSSGDEIVGIIEVRAWELSFLMTSMRSCMMAIKV